MTKKELREKYFAKREALSQDEVLTLSAKISENFISQFKPDKQQKAHVFISIAERKEFDTSIMIEYFFTNGIRVFVPKIHNQKLISIEIFPDTVWEISNWGIKEPVSNEDSGETNFDFVVTPLLYCDHHGNRVGYGKGFYDGLFHTLSPNVLKIGVGFFSPNEVVDDVWEHDIPLDYLVTPTSVLSFTALG